MMRIFLLSFLLSLPGFVRAQKISDPSLKPYVELWQDDGVDSLKIVLPVLVKKYPKQPEVLFFQSVFESDADKACAGYEAILKSYPDNVLADESLFRLIQLDYAKGSYEAARSNVGRLKNKYPLSRFMNRADQMFAGLARTEQITTEEKIPDSSAEVKPAGKKFRLQVGAFGQIKNAEDLRDKLKSAGYAPIEFSEKTVNEKKLYLVWVGAFDSKEEAAKNGDVLKNKFKLTFTIVEK